MKTSEWMLIAACVLGISAGQILFKLAALSLQWPVPYPALLRQLANPYLIIGLGVYFISTVLWIWLLRTVPLNVAYPVVALAFLIVPALSAVFLGEPFALRGALGGALIVAGVYVIAG